MQTPGFSLNTKIERLDRERFQRLENYRTCDLADVMHRAHTMIGIRGIYSPIQRVVGPATTVSIPCGGFDMIRLALSHAHPGDILVIATQGNSLYAHWGGDMSRHARAAGIGGVVIDGAARDAREIQKLGFPVFATTTATAAATVEAPWGEINAAVACGRTVVSPGDIVVADDDGIVAIPPPYVDVVADVVDALEGHEWPAVEDVAERLRSQGLVVDSGSA